MKKIIAMFGLIVFSSFCFCYASEPLLRPKNIVRDAVEIVGVVVPDNLQEIEIYMAYGAVDANGVFTQNSQPFSVTSEDFKNWTTASKTKDFLLTLRPEADLLKSKIMKFMRDENLIEKISQKYQP